MDEFERIPEPTPEEMQKLLEKAKKDLQAALAKMTPEERKQAALNARKLIQEDKIAKQKLIDEAAAVFGSPAPETPKQKFCTNCGAPVTAGKFCEYCGSPLGNG